MTSTTTITSPSLIHAAAGNLRPVVAALARVIPSKPASAELGQVLVEPVDHTTLRLSGTDGTTFLAVDILGTVDRQAEPFLAPLAQLQAHLRETRPADRVDLVPGKIPVERFPNVPRLRGTPVSLEPKVGQAILRAFACSSADETRQVLRGAFVDASGGAAHGIVGTDGKHLYASNSFRLPELKESVILPAHKVWKSPLLRAAVPWTLRVGADSASNNRWYRIDTAVWSLTGKLIEGTFPAYHQVIPEPSSFGAGLVFPERSLPELIKLIGTLPGNRPPFQTVGLRLKEGRACFLGRESDTDSFQEHPVPAAEVRGEAATVFFNREYLSKALTFGLNRLEIIDAVSPVKLHRADELMIVMPVRCVTGQEPRKRPGKAVGEGLRKPEKTPEPVVRSENGSPKRGGEKPREPEGEALADPIEVASRQLVQVREALKVADARLTDLVGTLRGIGRNQRQTEREIRAVRGTLRHLRRIEL